jgi:hypothetical protein
VLDVAGFPVVSNWHVVRSKGRQPSPVARVFQEHLRIAAGKWTARQVGQA